MTRGLGEVRGKEEKECHVQICFSYTKVCVDFLLLTSSFRSCSKVGKAVLTVPFSSHPGSRASPSGSP